MTLRRRIFIGLLVAALYSIAIAAVTAHADPVAPSGMWTCHELAHGGMGLRIISAPEFGPLLALAVLVLAFL